MAQWAHAGRHVDGIREALPADLTFFGHIPPSRDVEIPDRHLGLYMGDESPITIDDLDAPSEGNDVNRLLEVAREPPSPPPVHRDPTSESCIGVAADAAFSFVYPATLERFREWGEVVTFSPVAGDPVPDCDGLYLPSGYPELDVEELASSPTLESISRRAASGLPIFGECGGLMTLAETLETTDGNTVEMARVLPADVQMQDRYQALDHVKVTAGADTLTANAGDRLRGHEFHYSSTDVDTDAEFVFSVERSTGVADGKDGLVESRSLGTYTHVHPESGAFDTFLDSV